MFNHFGLNMINQKITFPRDINYSDDELAFLPYFSYFYSLKVRMDGWMGGWMDAWMDGWVCGRMGVWKDGWMDGWMDRWMNGWIDT